MIEWAAAGLAPDSFWRQTPRSFAAIMEGRARAAKRNFELALSQAWHTEAFAREKRLKKLAEYLEGPPKARTADEILDAFLMFQALGAPMTIREVN